MRDHWARINSLAIYVNQDGNAIWMSTPGATTSLSRLKRNTTNCYRLLDTAVLNEQSDARKPSVAAKVKAGTVSEYDTIDELAKGQHQTRLN